MPMADPPLSGTLAFLPARSGALLTLARSCRAAATPKVDKCSQGGIPILRLQQAYFAGDLPNPMRPQAA